ncbi:hypothetical protein [Pseudonocardia sp. HH130629-09]|uniref:hypothetical protein n=1 Tax=Pseudonocardia sp. HH130629-09 TaxID=1641402 RepID=UPI0006CB68C6|nr:hypothetical protein [Pseudonocardia sp. HH130629-09]ALE84130.1 hypothetical protein XF36_14130 [Pseudonocardia sp. HH130629-09]
MGTPARERSATPTAAVTAVVTAVLAGLLGGCASTVAGTPWPTGQGPALPSTAAAPVEPTRRPPTSFTVPGPLSNGPLAAPTTDGRPTTTVPPVPVPPSSGLPDGRDGGDGTARTVPPVPVGDGASRVPDGRARPAPDAARAAPTRAAAPAPLTSDVVADECLLDRAALTGLLGGPPVAPATNAVVTRTDGTRTRACFALADGVTVSVNVYTTNRGTPAGYVAGARHGSTVTGLPAGTSATVLDTVAGPTLQLATDRYLVTVAVAGRTPSRDQWRTAAVAAAVPR